MFQSNSASGAGGAVMLEEAENAEFSDCNFQDNVAYASGGAVETVSGSSQFSSCEFGGNSAGEEKLKPC